MPICCYFDNSILSLYLLHPTSSSPLGQSRDASHNIRRGMQKLFLHLKEFCRHWKFSRKIMRIS